MKKDSRGWAVVIFCTAMMMLAFGFYLEVSDKWDFSEVEVEQVSTMITEEVLSPGLNPDVTPEKHFSITPDVPSELKIRGPQLQVGPDRAFARVMLMKRRVEPLRDNLGVMAKN